MTQLAELNHYLRSQISGQQISHAFIFSGGNAFEQAFSLAAALVCLQNGETVTACGSCASCRNMLALSHPDCRVVEPQKGLHRAEAIRQLIADACLSPVVGERKVFIIKEAEKISEEAANTLLKLLEEPNEDTTLILVCQQINSLLPTILSRCQLFVFADDEEDAVSVSEELRQDALALLSELPQLAIYQVLLKARDYEKDREGQKMFLLALLQELHAAARCQSQLPMGQEQAFRSANMVESCLELMEKNVNQKLLTDVVYLRLWQNSQG